MRGRNRKPRSVQGGVDQRPAAFVLSLGERDDQNEFLAPQTDEHH